MAQKPKKSAWQDMPTNSTGESRPGFYRPSQPMQIKGRLLEDLYLPPSSRPPTEDLLIPENIRRPATEDLSLPRKTRPPTEDLSLPAQPSPLAGSPSVPGFYRPKQPMQIKGRAPADMPYDGGVERLPQFDALTIPGQAPGQAPGDIRVLSTPSGTAQKLDTAPLAAALAGGQPLGGEAPQEGLSVAPGTPGATPVPETPEEADALQMYIDRRDAAVASEEAAQQGFSAEAGRLGQDSPLDLRPLAALTDTWTGSKLLPGFDRPRSNDAAISALKAAILKSKGNITDSETELLKSRMLAEDNASRDANKYASLEQRANALGLTKEALQEALFKQQYGLQGKSLASKEKIAGMQVAGARERAGIMGGALANQRQENRIEDRKIAATKLDDDRAIAITNSPVTKFYRAQGGLQKALDNYRRLVDRYGVSLMPGGIAKEMLQQAYGDVLLAKKSESELGVIAGPDMPLMNKAVPDATASTLALTHPGDVMGISSEGKESLLLRIDEALDNLKGNMQGTMGILRAAHPAGDSPKASSVVDALGKSAEPRRKSKSGVEVPMDALDAELAKRRAIKAGK